MMRAQQDTISTEVSSSVETERTRNDAIQYGDWDRDGVFNKYDLCPNEAGTVDNDGCPKLVDFPSGPYSDGDYSQYLPYADPDHDGVPNIADSCKNLAGLRAYHGCIPEESINHPSVKGNNMIQRFTLAYGEGSTILKISARKSLNHAFALLQKYPKAKLKILPFFHKEGDKEKELCNRRTSNIHKYLIEKRIPTNRIELIESQYADNLVFPAIDLLVVQGE